MFSMLSCLVGHLYVFSWKCLFRSSAHIFNQIIWALILSCVSSLYILYINPLSDTSFTNILSHAVGCLLVFLSMAYFTVQKLLSFTRSRLFIFAFVSFAWGDRSSDTTFLCTKKPKILCNSLYCDICFIVVVCNWIRISEVCLYILATFTITLFLSLLLADSSVSVPAFMETENQTKHDITRLSSVMEWGAAVAGVKESLRFLGVNRKR